MTADAPSGAPSASARDEGRAPPTRSAAARLPARTTTSRCRKMLRCSALCPQATPASTRRMDRENAHLGELSVAALKLRGVAGAVIDGGCRDVELIVREAFPVFSRFTTPQDATGRWEVVAHGDARLIELGGVAVVALPVTGSSPTPTASSSFRVRSPWRSSRRPRRRPRRRGGSGGLRRQDDAARGLRGLRRVLSRRPIAVRSGELGARFGEPRSTEAASSAPLVRRTASPAGSTGRRRSSSTLESAAPGRGRPRDALAPSL